MCNSPCYRHILRLRLFAFLCCSLWLPLLAVQAAPLAAEQPDTTHVQGERLIDPWAWLEQRDHPDLNQVLSNEEKYAKANLKASGKLSKKLYKEFVRFIPREYTSYPYLQDGYRYFTKERRGQAYPVHYRIKDEPRSKTEMIMDETKLAKGSKFFQLDLFTVSPDAQKLAYSADFSGSEDYALYLKDLISGTTSATHMQNISQALWMKDNRRMVVTLVNSRYQTDSAWIYDTSTDQLTLLFQETDPAYNLGIYYSAGRELIFIDSASKNTNQTWFLSSTDANPGLVQIVDRVENRLAIPDYLNGVFFISTNQNNPDFEICSISYNDLGSQNWKTVVYGKTGEPISAFLVFDKSLAVLRRHQGFKRIELYEREKNELTGLIESETPSNLGFWVNTDPLADSLMYYRENELTPYSIIRRELPSGKETTVYQDKPAVLMDYSQYQIELHWVNADDGSKIPLRLIMRKDLDASKPHPLWLYGYGAYGDCEDPYYSDTLFPLLDRGLIYAVAHVRGGGELGKAWYDGGRTLNKINTFTDFISSIEYLTDTGYTTPNKLVIEGGSAGGLLIGAVVNMVPGKIRLAIADVPFVDIINTMLNPDLPLTAQEYEEWGNPSNPAEFKYMLSYSPYDNVRAQAYPSLLVSTAWNDIRVGYWEALKWVQKLRSRNLGSNPILFLMHWDEGHTGTNDRFKSLKNYARTVAYAISSVQ